MQWKMSMGARPPPPLAPPPRACNAWAERAVEEGEGREMQWKMSIGARTMAEEVATRKATDEGSEAEASAAKANRQEEGR